MELQEAMVVLWLAERMRQFVETVDECLELLSREDQEVIRILADPDGEKIMRICEEQDVTTPTAYRRKDQALQRISKLFNENDLRIL